MNILSFNETHYCMTSEGLSNVISVLHLQDSCPPRVVWGEEVCGCLQETSYTHNPLQLGHSWHRSIHLNIPAVIIQRVRIWV